jgi:hypothetical protein
MSLDSISAFFRGYMILKKAVSAGILRRKRRVDVRLYIDLSYRSLTLEMLELYESRLLILISLSSHYLYITGKKLI